MNNHREIVDRYPPITHMPEEFREFISADDVDDISVWVRDGELWIGVDSDYVTEHDVGATYPTTTTYHVFPIEAITAIEAERDAALARLAEREVQIGRLQGYIGELERDHMCEPGSTWSVRANWLNNDDLDPIPDPPTLPVD